MAKGRGRIEPNFDVPEGRVRDRGELDLRLSREDRPGAGDGVAKRSGGTARQPGKGPSKTTRPAKARGRRRRSWLGRIVYGTVVLGLWAVIGLAGLIAYHASQLPPIDQLAVPKRPPNIAILASDGSLLANRGETGGRVVSIKELPPYLPRAFVAIEDRRFYQHFGVDPVGILRAIGQNLTRRGVAQGGSTLTQQLAKNLFLTPERSASRKIQEAILALWLEHKYTKDEILELYLNRVYFGAGAYGVEAAAQRYFGKPAKEVSLAQAAMLGGLVQAPSRLAPNRNLPAAQARAAQVLAAMQELGFASAQDVKVALAQPAEPANARGGGSANYVADLVMDVLDDYVGKFDTDITVQTTVDTGLQASAEKALDRRAQRQGRAVQRQPGRPGLDAARRGDPRADRRARLRPEPVQPRHHGQAPARLLVQALRLPRRRGARRHARHRPGGCADPHRQLGSGELFPSLRGPGHPAHGARPLAQHGRGAPGPGGRPQGRGPDRAAAGHHLAAPGQRLDRARHLRSHAAGDGRRLRGLRQRRQRRDPLRGDRREGGRRQGALQAVRQRARPGHRAPMPTA